MLAGQSIKGRREIFLKPAEIDELRSKGSLEGTLILLPRPKFQTPFSLIISDRAKINTQRHLSITRAQYRTLIADGYLDIPRANAELALTIGDNPIYDALTTYKGMHEEERRIQRLKT